MNIDSNNEILTFTNYLIANGYTVNPASEGIKRKYLTAQRGEEYYMIELGALGTDGDGYGIYRIRNQEERTRISETIPITEFDPVGGIRI